MKPSSVNIELDESPASSSRRLLDDIEAQDLPDHAHIISEISEKPVKRKSTSYLDGLRGVAALCVFTQHFIGGDDHHHGYHDPAGHDYFISIPFIRVFWSGGAAAVAVFFVLSGFVLSQSSIKLLQRGNRAKCKTGLVSAIVRRPVRLYFPCWAVSLAIAIVMHIPGGFYPKLAWSQGQETFGQELVHWLVVTVDFFQPFQTHSWATSKYEYDLPTWTIPLELKGSMFIYGLCGFICLIPAAEMAWFCFLAILTVIMLGVGWWWGGCFAAGLALTFIDLYELDDIKMLNKIPRIVRIGWLHFLFVASWYLLSQPVSDGHPEWSLDAPGWYSLTMMIPGTYTADDYYRFWLSYGAMIFIYCLLRLRWLQYIFDLRPIQYLGKVSFMLYLIHQPLMICVGDRIKRVFGELALGDDHRWYDNLLYVPDVGPRGLSLRWDIDWTLMLMVTLFVAHFATRFIDEPCVRLGRSLSNKMGL